MQVDLPHGLSCSQCVVQWTYYTGNTWGVCSNGTEGMGCGDQEMFRNCADVMINSVVGSYPPGALSSMQPQLPLRGQLYTETGQLASPLVVTARVCVATELYNSISGHYHYLSFVYLMDERTMQVWMSGATRAASRILRTAPLTSASVCPIVRQ